MMGCFVSELVKFLDSVTTTRAKRFDVSRSSNVQMLGDLLYGAIQGYTMGLKILARKGKAEVNAHQRLAVPGK